MKVTPSEYNNNQFKNANQARCYQRAKEMETAYSQLSTDVLTLDNKEGVDCNSDKGFVVLNKAKLSNAKPSGSPMVKMMDPVHGISCEATGELKLNEEGKSEFRLSGYGHTMLAEYNHGLFGLGQERLELTAFKPGSAMSETATFFSDGTVAYETNWQSSGPR